MVPFAKFFEETNLSGYVLLLPSVSVGNVPQLTADLIISSLPCSKVATLWHPAIVSSVGGDPYDDKSKDISTACELYVNTDRKLAVIQLRSAIEFNLAKDFFRELKSFVLQHNIANTVILTASFDYELHNITKEKFYYISNYPMDEAQFDNLPPHNKIKKFESTINGRYLVHGSGFGVKLHEFFGSEIKSIVLVKFVSEGDNVRDAINYLEILSRFIEQYSFPNQIKMPFSWKYVYGGPPPAGIY